jgi:heptosyltransferase III
MKMINLDHKTIIISRTDSIGDVCLTLPITAYLKSKFKNLKIIFLGNSYTKDILKSCGSIDEIIDWNEVLKLAKEKQIEYFKSLNAEAIIHVFPKKEIAILAKKSNITYRIGSSHRLFHWFTCNKRVNFTRKNAQEHESQLNFYLLKPLGIRKLPSFSEINSFINFKPQQHIPNWLEEKIANQKIIILHPKSQGSAVEWGLENFMDLSLNLAQKGYTIAFTGTEKEGLLFRNLIPNQPNIIDTTGKLSLAELIDFISKSHALVAASTGPLHIAGLLNIKAIGLFAPKRPIHPGRWSPLGGNSKTIVFDENCNNCKNGKPCNCITKIEVQKVAELIC